MIGIDGVAHVPECRVAKALRTEVDKTSPAYLELKNSIKEKGLLNAISVRRVMDDAGTTQLTNDHGEPKFRLVDGLHRHTAMADLNFDETSVNVVGTKDEDLLATQIAANAIRVETPKGQYAQALKQILQLTPKTLEDLALQVGKPVDWVKKMLSITKLPQSVLDLVDNGRMPVYNAIALARLPEDRVQEYVSQATTQSVSEFAPAIDEVVKAINKSIRDGKPEVAVFMPKPKARTLTVLQTVDNNTLSSVIAGKTDPVEIAKAAVLWAISLDPESVAAQKSKWDNDQAAKEAKKAQVAREKLIKAGQLNPDGSPIAAA